MRLSITKIKQQPSAVQRYQLIDDQLDPTAYGYTDFRLSEPVSFTGRVINNGDGLFEVCGSYKTKLQLICSR